MNNTFSKSIQGRKERMANIIDILSDIYPNIQIQLNYSNPFELLIATMLSAQCTDARVNLVTTKLFSKYIIPEDYLKVPIEELETDIFSTGFYKAKAKNIRGTCELLIHKFNGKVPEVLEDLILLPGVGRKTANVVLGHCFNTPAIVVDTHVTRISNRLGFVATNDAYKIELELMKVVHKEQWIKFTHLMINHGRNTCIARKPKCNICKFSHLCEYYRNYNYNHANK
ncbi:MAG TPA: endonuclease III [Candidatus Kapabacteria bacterium]|nr:endonuclease III [Candidatus Kapabacteria bacterium]